MKNKVKAFTLIEILISITIVSIISVVSLNWFLNFLEENTLKLKTSKILNNIESLDKKVENKEIFDYKVVFDKNYTNSSYIIYENIAWEDIRQEIKSISSYINPEIRVILSWTWWSNWYANVYKEHKINIAQNIVNQEYGISFQDWYDYSIYWTLSWTTNKVLNNIKLKQIDKQENEILISQIRENKLWSDIHNLTIKNINWKKQLTNSWNTISEAYIYFDKNWVESFIKITD